MSTTDSPASFLSSRTGVRELLAAGADMAAVERAIEADTLDRDQKDALWLWAIGQRARTLGAGGTSPQHRPTRHAPTKAAERPPRREPGRGPGFAGTVQDELAKLRGRNLGACAACGKPVYFEQNFTRFRGRVVHVRCPIDPDFSAAPAPSLDGLLAPHPTSPER
jgi:hypothetical protein